MIRLVVSDIDGTLVPEGVCDINPEYIEVIRTLCEKGITFVVATGRQASSAKAIFDEVSEYIYYVADNGAYIEKNAEVIHEACMDKPAVDEFLEDLKHIPNCCAVISAREGYYTDVYNSKLIELLFDDYKGEGQIVENIGDYTDRCLKISIYCKEGSLPVYQQIYEKWKGHFEIQISGRHWVDVNDFTATKGQAIEVLQKSLGISVEETMAFGDNFNDISMLKRAGESYASVLSGEEIKKEAKYEVASYKEDGVLQILKGLLEELICEK